MGAPLRIPRVRRAQRPAWVAAVGRWFARAGLHLQEQQLAESIARIQLLGDADTDPAALPILQARLAEVRAELAALGAQA